MSVEELELVAASAREHAAHVHADIRQAGTRIEHIRLTILAVEADKVASSLEAFLRIAKSN